MFSDIEILEKICKDKLKRLDSKGFNLGYKIPTKREVPIVKIESNHIIIAEIKRASPALGNISHISNPIELAKEYVRQGASAISVLCEEDYFKGSLQDLMSVKMAMPNSCILRKDFIVKKEEIEVSYIAGADMVLLIAAIFMRDFNGFKEIYDEILSFNLTPLLEIHNKEEWEFISRLDLSHAIVGINSRNLKTFKINKMAAMRLRAVIPPHINVIFESGINSSKECFNIASANFAGVLCGGFLVSSLMQNVESNAKNSALKDIGDALNSGRKYNFLSQLINRKRDNVPLVKICGINDLEFLKAAALHADMLGFILTDKSARYVDYEFVKSANEILDSMYPCNNGELLDSVDKNIESNYTKPSLRGKAEAIHTIKSLEEIGKENKRHNPHLQIQKIKIDSKKPLRVGVVFSNDLQVGIDLISKGLLDVLQIHDKTTTSPNEASNKDIESIPHYKACNLTSIIDSKDLDNFLLIDSSEGNNNAIDIALVERLIESNPNFTSNLWLAGGISRHNLDSILSLNPMLIDICSSLESSKGVKDIERLKSFFEVFNARYK